MEETVLRVKDLKVDFLIKKHYVNAVTDMNFSIKKGKVLCLVGESGCGKSVTASSVMRLLSKDNSRVDKGEILFRGQDILKMNDRELFQLRGQGISMIFQDALTALDPVYRIGTQMMEQLLAHEEVSREEARARCLKLLMKVGIPEAAQRLNEYPHQLSGGMRQRVMIAMSLLCSPKLLIADEPTTALDVTIQAQILHLLKQLKDDLDMSILLITHDMGVVADMADEVIVMYAGQIVEHAMAEDLFEEPLHPYTKDLLRSIPTLNKKTDRLYSIQGTVPGLGEMPKGCRFSNRCSKCMKICTEKMPALYRVEGRKVRCWKYGAMYEGGVADE